MTSFRKELKGYSLDFKLSDVAKKNPGKDELSIIATFIDLKGTQKFGSRAKFLKEQAKHGTNVHKTTYFSRMREIENDIPISFDFEKFSNSVKALGYKDINDFSNKEGVEFRFIKTYVIPLKIDGYTASNTAQTESKSINTFKKDNNFIINISSKLSEANNENVKPLYFVELNYLDKDKKAVLVGRVTATTSALATTRAIDLSSFLRTVSTKITLRTTITFSISGKTNRSQTNILEYNWV